MKGVDVAENGPSKEFNRLPTNLSAQDKKAARCIPRFPRRHDAPRRHGHFVPAGAEGLLELPLQVRVLFVQLCDLGSTTIHVVYMPDKFRQRPEEAKYSRIPDMPKLRNDRAPKQKVINEGFSNTFR